MKTKDLHNSTLRKLEEDKNGASFGYITSDGIYDNYFGNDMLDEIIGSLSDEWKEKYSLGSGSELVEKRNGWGRVNPPKMMSVASSSRFCAKALKSGVCDVFHPGMVKFTPEEKLPILKNSNAIPCNMDAYSKDHQIYVECKCQEFLSYHQIELSVNYFNKGLFVDDIGDEYKLFKTIKNKNGTREVFEIDEKAFGLDHKSNFEIKQLITHLLGITGNKEQCEKAKLIFFYFIPDELLKNENIRKLYNHMLEDSASVFNSPIIKNVIIRNNIKIEMYIMHSDTVEDCNMNNTRKVYPVDSIITYDGKYTDINPKSIPNISNIWNRARVVKSEMTDMVQVFRESILYIDDERIGDVIKRFIDVFESEERNDEMESMTIGFKDACILFLTYFIKIQNNKDEKIFELSSLSANYIDTISDYCNKNFSLEDKITIRYNENLLGISDILEVDGKILKDVSVEEINALNIDKDKTKKDLQNLISKKQSKKN